MPRIHIIPELNNIEEYLSFAKDNGLAFEYNEFFMPDLISSKDLVEYLNLDSYEDTDAIKVKYMRAFLRSKGEKERKPNNEYEHYKART